MIDLLFRFEGRLNRAQHLIASSCVSLVAGFVIVAVLLTMQHFRGERALIPGSWILAASPLAIPFLWAYLSMQAARLRDIGVSPRHVFLGVAAINIASFVIGVALPGGALADIVAGVCKVANTAYGFALMFLPSDYKFALGGPAPFNPAPVRIETDRTPGARPDWRDGPIFGRRKSRQP